MSDASSSSMVTEPRAHAAILEFFRVEGYQLTLLDVRARVGSSATETHPNLGALRTYRGSLGILWVSPRAAVVFFAGTMNAGTKPVSEQQAREIAERFASAHVLEFHRRNFIADAPNGSATGIRFRWEEAARPGREISIFPNWVEVVVALANGAITQFNASDLLLLRNTAVTLSERAARDRIKAFFQRAAIDEITLMEYPVDGKVVTIWTAMVTSLENGELVPHQVSINADTGERIH
jgi:hypothetical protein